MTTTPSLAAEQAFDLFGDLPVGTTLLEASAGTGKTFAIAAMATRYVALGQVELGEVLLVTFGRAATSELRERVRSRLSTAQRGLDAPDAAQSRDALVAHLADAEPAEVRKRRDRLTRALSEFDAATITTTHGFCRQMLEHLGVLADVDPLGVMVGDVADLCEEVIGDVYLSRYATSPQPPFELKEAKTLARAALRDRFAKLEPASAPAESPAWHRVAFARAVVAEVDRRKQERHLLDYDDLLVRLRAALEHPDLGPLATQRLRQRYRVVLVDEFQDTDPVQWDILRRAFHGHATLVLVGDPKQAIYAFRGGDVIAYLQARKLVQDEGTLATLNRNWRSSPDLLRGMDHLFRSVALGDPAIVVQPMSAGRASDHPPSLRYQGRPVPSVRLRQLTTVGITGSRRPEPWVGETRRAVVQDVAAEVLGLLQHGTLNDRPVQPGDIAILTRRNQDAADVQTRLRAAGIPAVVSGMASVFSTQAARDWLTLLDALADPTFAGRTAAAALTPFLGWTAERLATAGDAARQDLSRTVRRWARVCADQGVGVLIEELAAHGTAERLSAAGGERLLTDSRHIGELLRSAAGTQRLDAAALAEWLRTQIHHAPTEYAETMSRRLDTDAAAVQVLTVHASKGLQFPIVLVPFGWDRPDVRTPESLHFHDDSGRRILHLGGTSEHYYAAALKRYLTEDRGEDLRLLYVAVTRAESQVILWWAPSRTNSIRGAVTRLLLGDVTPGQSPPEEVPGCTDDKVETRLATLAQESDGSIDHDVVAALDGADAIERWRPDPAATDPLAAAQWNRRLDLQWRRLSYSVLTSAAHEIATKATLSTPLDPIAASPARTTMALAEAALDSAGPDTFGPDTYGRAGGAVLDEPESAAPDDGETPDLVLVADAEPVPLSDLPAGATFGTVVHAVLERYDPGAVTAQRPAEVVLRSLATEEAAGQLDAQQLDVLASGLAQAVRTPLGPLAGDRSLDDFSLADRLSELDFELPLAGGDVAGSSRMPAHLREIAILLRRYLPDDDPLAGYPDRLDELIAVDPGSDAVLRGYLTGSIDAVLRVGSAPNCRYLVADYKSNRLAPNGVPLTAAHYRPEAMQAEMLHAHYPLQLLLYLVALHRFLRWRVPDYDPQQHLGGGLYLFLRGMWSSERSDGVFAWAPPTGLIPELSALLDGRAPQVLR